MEYDNIEHGNVVMVRMLLLEWTDTEVNSKKRVQIVSRIS